jgi:ATP-dependent helicase/DNAse subunit B
MSKDKYLALWVSHTSIADFIACPRRYYLKNIYRNPTTGHKIKIISPPLALGSAIHEVVESLSILPVEERFKQSLIEKFAFVWKKYHGKKGGFLNLDTEKEYQNRGENMLKKIIEYPGPLLKKAVKIKAANNLPYFWLSEKDNIILCGKIDWLEYLEETDSVHIIDFKTSQHDEEESSLQLPIYYLLAKNCQNRFVKKPVIGI